MLYKFHYKRLTGTHEQCTMRRYSHNMNSTVIKSELLSITHHSRQVYSFLCAASPALLSLKVSEIAGHVKYSPPNNTTIFYRRCGSETCCKQMAY